MCTVIALHRCVPGFPLVLAANRDEFFERPAEGIALRETTSGMILAPRDQRAGGTWLGLNAWGLLAAVTNVSGQRIDPSRRSRGLLVLDALSARRASDAAERIDALPADAYNPFNLLIADRDTAHWISCIRVPQRIQLAPGVHVIGNTRAGAETPRIARQRQLAEEAARAPTGRVLDRLAQLCRDHADGQAREATCVHGDRYGTRSSTLLQVGEESGAGELRHLEGPPCNSEYQDFTPLLQRLGLESSSAAGGFTVRSRS
ncbi:MAG: NRDE family protein [Myxococcales bacterium]|nr:NRDE family protein [Myxococcales bacterium]